MSKDEKLCEEIDAEARKRYVGKVAEARATARYAADPEPCSPKVVSLVVVVFVIVVIGIAYRSGHPAGAGADSSNRSGAPAIQSATFKDVRTTVGLINKMTKLADSRCEKSGSCGFSAETSDRSADPATDNVYRLGYSPRNDDTQHTGWETFRSLAELLDCDLHAAFSWTKEDDRAGRRPASDVTVFC